MTLNLRRLVPITSGALLFLLSGCEESNLSQHIKEGGAEEIQPMYGAILGETAAVEAATIPDPNALYNAAVALGGDAQYTAERARSTADWERAAMGWERALNFLRAIPKGSTMYRSAQAKIYDYEGRLEKAMGRVRRASNESGGSTLALAADPGADRSLRRSANALGRSDCQAAAPGGADILLTDLQIQVQAGEALLTGCITNRTDQPISAIALTYSPTDGEAAMGQVQAPLKLAHQDDGLAQDSLAPGQTAAFQQRYGIDPQVETITLELANWATGQGDPAQSQSSRLDVTVAR